MSAYLIYPLSALAGYIVGAIPFAVLIARAKGVDIFKVGSGNPGATNVLRNLGKPYGYACFLLDALKGVAAVLIGMGLNFSHQLSPDGPGIVALLAAIVGHSFSVFLNFRGGKGVATTVGGMLALMPMVMIVGAVLWLVVFFSFRYVSLASIVLGLSLPVTAAILRMNQLSIGFCAVLAILILVRHRSNIQRLIAGTENRSGGKKP